MEDELTDNEIDSRHLVLAQERQSKYYGTARIPLHALHLEDGRNFTISKKNIQRLVGIFERQHVQRLKPDNYISALVSRRDLERCLQASNLSMSTLLQDVNLPMIQAVEGVKFHVLHGQHRIYAAQEFIKVKEDHWWSVEIYDDRLSEANITQLIEVGSTSRRFCDGDIYRHLRLFEIQQDTVRSKEWACMLSPAKSKVVKQLVEEEDLASALDTLLPFVGLWAAWELGALKRILPLHCSEESINYLRKTRKTLDCIIMGHHDLRSLIDASTIQQLENLAPGLSLADRDSVKIAMDKNTLFPLISDQLLRGRILKQLYGLKEPIYSLRTYLEDTKLLQFGITPLRSLIPLGTKRSRNTSLRTRFQNAHKAVRSASLVPIQVSKDEFRMQLCHPSSIVVIKICQLFLLSLRFFVRPRKSHRGPNPGISESFESSLWKLASLAHRLGFETREIDEIWSNPPQTRLTVDFLLSQWPDDEYDCPPDERYQLATEICTRMSEYTRRQPISRVPIFTTDLVQQPKVERYGRPLDDDHKVNKEFLYFDKIFDPHRLPPARFLTSFAMTRFAILAFFSDLTLRDLHEDELDNKPSPPPSEGQILTHQPEPPARHAQLASSSDPASQQESLDTATMDPPMPDGAFTKLVSTVSLDRFVQAHLQSAAFEKVILYLHNDQHFTRFSKNEEARDIFQKLIQDLANEDYCFYVVLEGARVKFMPIQRLWLEAQKFCIVIAVKKCKPASGHYPFVGGSLAALLASLESASIFDSRCKER